MFSASTKLCDFRYKLEKPILLGKDGQPFEWASEALYAGSVGWNSRR